MKLINADCRWALKILDSNSVDSICTDPPYEINFMDRAFDKTGIAHDVEMWKECLRVLKPGGYLCAFGATRTYHRMACAIEDAGFNIRDSLHWVQGQGMPKGHNISKAIDKKAGAKRKVVGVKPIAYPDSDCWGIPNKNKGSKSNQFAKSKKYLILSGLFNLRSRYKGI